MVNLEGMTDFEVSVRKQLVEIAKAMLDKKISFFEGAKFVVALRSQIGGVADFDPDFKPFVVIFSETDHLPYQDQRYLWSAEALEKLKPEFEHTEIWAEDFASDACKRLIARFSGRRIQT